MRVGKQKIIKVNCWSNEAGYPIPVGWRVVSMVANHNEATVYVCIEQVIAEDRL